jgi:hypothetical protein
VDGCEHGGQRGDCGDELRDGRELIGVDREHGGGERLHEGEHGAQHGEQRLRGGKRGLCRRE